MQVSRRHALTALLGALAVAIPLAGCSSQPSVRHDQDPTVDLKSYRSFAFYDPLSTDGPRFGSLLSSHLKQAARAQLEQRHYQYDPAQPELAVDFRVDLLATPEFRANAAGGAWRLRGGSTTIDTSYQLEGALHVALVDLRRQTVVWHGVAANRLTDETLKNPGPVVEQAVQQIMAGLAPR